MKFKYATFITSFKYWGKMSSEEKGRKDYIKKCFHSLTILVCDAIARRHLNK